MIDKKYIYIYTIIAIGFIYIYIIDCNFGFIINLFSNLTPLIKMILPKLQNGILGNHDCCTGCLSISNALLPF